MAPEKKKIIDKFQEMMANPELDRMTEEVRKALEEVKSMPDKADVVALILERGKRGLAEDMRQLEIPAEQQARLLSAFETRFRVASTNLEREAILSSLEGRKLNDFVDIYAKKGTNLDEIIEEYKKRDSKKPLKKLIRAGVPLLAGVGASLMQWLNEEKKGNEKKEGEETEETEGEEAESESPEAGAAAEAGAEPEGEKAGENNKDNAPAGPRAGGESTGGATSPIDYSRTTVESGGTVKYEINPDNAKKLSPEEFRKRYESIKDRHARYAFVLQQVAAGNTTNAFEKLKIKTKAEEGGDIEVEIDVDCNALEVAGTTVHLDGPTAVAAAQLTKDARGNSCTIPTAWLSEQIYKHAKETGGAVPFISYDEIVRSLGKSKEEAYVTSIDPKTGKEKISPNGDFMMSASFALERDRLLKKYLKDNKIPESKIKAGHYKDVVYTESHPEQLEIFGGHSANGTLIQGTNSNAETRHEIGYGDYSHGVRRIGRKVRVTEGGKTTEMDIDEFYASAKYAKAFGFPPRKPGQAYPYSPELQKFVDEQEAKKKGKKPKDKKKTS